MDIQTILEKLPAFIAKFQDAKNIDGKVTFADVIFALDLVQLAFSKSVVQAQEGYYVVQGTAIQGRGSEGDEAVPGLSSAPIDPDDHDQMMKYLATIPTLARFTDQDVARSRGVASGSEGGTEPASDASKVKPTDLKATSEGLSVVPSDQPRELVEWVHVAIIGFNLLGKLVAALKKKKVKS